MSIRPAFADAILQGKKRVEFRKKPIAPDVTHVIVYATQPVKAVVGAFSVKGQETADPESLWRKYCHIAGIDRGKFDAYYGAHSQGTGIQIGEVLRASSALDLEVALGLPRPPQSFRYIDVSLARRLLDSFLLTPCDSLSRVPSMPS